MAKDESKGDLSAPVASAPTRRICQGPVMPIGGAGGKDEESDQTVLNRFMDLAGGKRSRIAVVPTASETPEEMGERYIKVFGNLGAKSVDVIDVKERSDANSDSVVEMLRQASGIFITGGAQANLVALLAGTLAMETIRLRNAEGIVVAGTSAGASIVASHMMVGGTGLAGNSNSAAARKALVE